eukprot:8418603-Ditylum_brightwellii.AAC.1
MTSQVTTAISKGLTRAISAAGVIKNDVEDNVSKIFKATKPVTTVKATAGSVGGVFKRRK